jgi:hypothetical protein
LTALTLPLDTQSQDAGKEVESSSSLEWTKVVDPAAFTRKKKEGKKTASSLQIKTK